MNMKYIMTLLILLSIFANITSAMVDQEQTINKIKYVEGEIITKNISDKDYKLVKLPTGITVEQAIKEYKNKPGIQLAEPNYIVHVTNMPNDPYFSYLWGMNNVGQNGGVPGIDIRALEAWNITTNSKDVIVAVIDSGVAYNHPDLSDNMWKNPGEIPDNNIDDDNNGFVDDIYGIDVCNNDSDPMDDYSHGTLVSGIIGAVGNNSEGLVGVNWNTKIMAIKFISSYGNGTIFDAITSIKYAIMMNASVMSNSWGAYGYSQAMENVIKEATDKGIIFVAAAGNEGYNIDITPFCPTNCPNVITVAAIDRFGKLASFSNYGIKTVELGAPGVEIYSTSITGYGGASGTSMATPYVAGVAAMLKGKYPNATRQEIENKLLNGTTPLPSLYNKTMTGGMLNAYNSLKLNNTPPLAIDQNITTNEDHTIDIILNGYDKDSDTLTFSIYTQPAHGIITLDQNFTYNGILKYTPSQNYNGVDAFKFKVNDGITYSQEGIVKITIKEVSRPTICWNGNNTYLVNNKDKLQINKFALCVSGIYYYNRTVFEKGNTEYIAYEYIDTEINNKWNITKIDSITHPIYEVIINDIRYKTNKNYYTNT